MTAACRLFGWARRRAENVLSLLLVVMFVAFILQIVTRYVLNAPLSWTAELSTLAWVWGVLWGAGLVLRDEEAIRFAILYGALPGLPRRVIGTRWRERAASPIWTPWTRSGSPRPVA